MTTHDLLGHELAALREIVGAASVADDRASGERTRHQRELAAIDIDMMTIAALGQGDCAADDALRSLLVARLRLRVATLALDVIGPYAAPDYAGLGHNVRIGPSQAAGVADAYFATVRAQAEAELKAYEVLAATLFDEKAEAEEK